VDTKETTRERLYYIMEKSSPDNHLGRFVDFFLIFLISLNVIAVVLETVESISFAYADLLYGFELVSVIIFTVEYLIRISVCTVNPKFRHPIWGRVRFVFSFYAVIDFLAILPFYHLLH